MLTRRSRSALILAYRTKGRARIADGDAIAGAR